MSLIRTKGNLIDMAEAGHFDIIVHGCNCQNTMGSGIAKEIKDRYPQAFEADTSYHDYFVNPVHLLGTYSSVEVTFNDHHFDIVNAYTQLNYVPRGIDHFEYLSFEMILRKLEHVAGRYNFGFPYIGMDLAGGDKVRIISLLEQFADHIAPLGGTATLVEFDESL